MRRLLCASFLTVDVVVAVVALAVHGADSGSPSAAPPTSTRSSATPSGSTSATADAHSLALAWMAEQVPHSAPVLADDATRDELRALGFRAAGRPAHPAYAVSTAALRRLAAREPAVAATLRAAVPIADFDTAAGHLVIGRVVDVPASALAQHRRQDAQLRRSAGNALVRNPTFSAGTSVRSALTDGEIDLRAATALALMAANGNVELQSVTSTPAEARAGLPIRTVTFRATPEAGQRALLVGLTQTYRPQTWTRLPDGSFRVTWPIRPDPDDSRR